MVFLVNMGNKIPDGTGRGNPVVEIIVDIFK